jgi:hypothetical protein
MAILGKEVIGTIWSKTPTVVKWYFGVVVIPNLIVFGAIFYIWGVPWHYNTIHATILTYEEKRDLQTIHLIEKQQIQNDITNATLQRIERQQETVVQAMIRRQK